MNEKETRELIEELINSPQYCIFCGGLIVDYGKTDTGYSMTKCSKCGYIFSEE
jgi:hypothetical protein